MVPKTMYIKYIERKPTIMNKLANIALTALIATTAIVGTARGAQAACYPHTAANEVANLVRGGVDGGDAIRESIRRGNIDSEMCARQMLGYMRSNPYVFGDVLN